MSNIKTSFHTAIDPQTFEPLVVLSVQVPMRPFSVAEGEEIRQKVLAEFTNLLDKLYEKKIDSID